MAKGVPSDTENLLILSGKITDGPFLSPGPLGGSVDFIIKAGSGSHQCVSIEPDIVKNRSSISGRVRVFGTLSSKDGDSVILARRIEFR